MTGVPADISYCLECATETFDMTSDVQTYYYRFNAVPVGPLVDDRTTGDENIGESLRGLSRTFYTLYDKWFYEHQGTVEERVWCAASGTRTFGRQSAEVVDSLVSKFISDCLKEGRNPELRREQQSWLDRSRVWTHAEKLSARLARKINDCPLDMMEAAIRRPHEFINELPARPRHMIPMLADDTDEDWIEGVLDRPVVLIPKRRQRTRENNRVLKKSSAFLSRLIGSTETRMFVGGKNISVRGKRFTFSIRKNNILSENHGALKISVIDHKTNRRVFDLCWYVDETPAMDQVSALVMAVRVGDEDEILRVGNMLSVDHEAVALNDELKAMMPSHHRPPDDDNPYDFGFRFPNEDAMMHLTPGTTEYHRSHPDVYRSFSRYAGARLRPERFPESIRGYFVMHRPETVRPFLEGTVGRQLLPEAPVAPLLVNDPAEPRLRDVARVAQAILPNAPMRDFIELVNS